MSNDHKRSDGDVAGDFKVFHNADLQDTMADSRSRSISETHIDVSNSIPTIAPAIHNHSESASVKSLFYEYWDVICTYIMVFSTMGLGIALVGPTLQLLGRQVGEESTAALSVLFIGRAFGFLVGSIGAGQIVDRTSRLRSQQFCVGCVLGSALMTVLYPMASSLAQLVGISFFAAIFMGSIDNLMQVFVLSLFKKQASPFLQALHAGFAFGAFLAPSFVSAFVTDLPDGTSTGPYEWAFFTMAIYMTLIAGLFVYQLARGRGALDGGAVRLTDEDTGVGAGAENDVELDMIRQQSPDPYQIPPALPADHASAETASHEGPRASSVFEAGDLTAVQRHSSFVHVAGAPTGLTDADMGGDEPHPSHSPTRPAAPTGLCEGTRVALKSAWRTGARNRGEFGGTGMVLVSQAALLLWLYVGTETGYGNLISTFATDKGFMGERSAALLASVYWGCFFLGRVIGVVASMRVPVRKLIVIDLAAALAFTVLLALGTDSEVLAWVCSGGLGLAVGSFYAGVMAWLDQVVEMSGQVISVVVVWVCIGEAVFPMAMALFMEINTDNFVYFSVAMMTGCCLVFASMDRYRTKHTLA